MATVVPADEIDLAVARPHVAVDDPDAAMCERTRGRGFTEVTQEPTGIGHASEIG